METIQRALLSRMSEATRGAVREATSRSLIGQGKTGSARRGGEPDNANRRFVTRYIERSTFLFIQKRRNFIYIYDSSCDSRSRFWFRGMGEAREVENYFSSVEFLICPQGEKY